MSFILQFHSVQHVTGFPTSHRIDLLVNTRKAYFQLRLLCIVNCLRRYNCLVYKKVWIGKSLNDNAIVTISLITHKFLLVDCVEL